MSSLLVHLWTLFALSISIIVARLVFRRVMLKAYKDFQSDDWIMVFVTLPLTAFTILTTFFDNADPARRITNRFVLEELHIAITWLIKACLLVLYWRIFPVAFSYLRRCYVQVVAAICALSFVITQIALLLGCHPALSNNPHCTTYHSYTIISLTFTTLTTIMVLVIPIPFIPTPRRLLLTLLMITGITILILGILGRFYILTAPTSRTYLFYYIYEITLLIVFANLPFLTSLVVTTTPARLREFGRRFSISREAVHLPLSSWPRSRRVSVLAVEAPPLRSSRLGSSITVTSGGTEKGESVVDGPVMRPASVRFEFGSGERPHSGKGWPLSS